MVWLIIILGLRLIVFQKTPKRKVPQSKNASFEKTVDKVFNLHKKHWLKQNVDAQIYL